MPAVAEAPVAHTAPNVRPPDPNASQGGQAHMASEAVVPQPGPAVAFAASHDRDGPHALPRRFLGPLPENFINSDEAEAKRRHLHELRRRIIGRFTSRDSEGDLDRRGSRFEGTFGTEHLPGGVRGAVCHIRIRRRSRTGEEVDEEVELDDEDDDRPGRPHLRGKKKKRKDVWIGESFDIGREFFPRQKSPSSPVRDIPPFRPGRDAEPQDAEGSRRPAFSTKSTQESFVTARTEFSDARTSNSTVNLHGDGYELAPRPSTSVPSDNGDSPKTRQSQASSLQPLISTAPDDEITYRVSPKAAVVSLKNKDSSASFRKRLKSAIRKPSNATLGDPALLDVPSKRLGTADKVKPKSVQFPVNPAEFMSDDEDGDPRPRKGNKAPADPEAVLAREGDEAEGTSAGASVAADDEDWEDEEEIRMGDVIMRDRMLVRVGYHREEPISDFDEEQQRRRPCARMDPFREYIVALRQDRLELYLDWRLPLTERFAKQKRLAFIIPLVPYRTHCTIFHPTDMTLCLTTSASRLHDEVTRMMRATTTRVGALRDRVKQSKQFEWLKRGRSGTHVFILKIPERSRALDWYWEMWRQLGGELPSWVDINVASLSTTIRLLLPEDKDEVGGRAQQRDFNPKTTVKTCFDMLEKVFDVDDLVRQRNEHGREELDLRLCWKAPSGEIDWVAHTTTVQGKRRNWALLAGLARLQNERHPGELDLRHAGHQPHNLRLEDGTSLFEPPGVEGYLIRHKSPSSPKEHVFLSTHDGNIYTTTMKNAHPPLMPGTEGKTPRDVFPEVYDTYREGENHRMASFLAHCVGCVDLRDITAVKLCSEGDGEPKPKDGQGEAQTWGQGHGSHAGRSFEIAVVPDQTVRFEAHTPAVAAQWVDRLSKLMAYWKRRHRVDARERMDAMQIVSSNDAFAGTELSNGSDNVLLDIWDWCTIQGCRPVCQAGRLFVKHGPWRKFRHRYIVLSGGSLITFKIKSKQAFHQRKARYPLFGAYVYSGMLAVEELHATQDRDALSTQHRVYQDGLKASREANRLRRHRADKQSSDGSEDTTFCIRLLKPKNGWKKENPWAGGNTTFQPPALSDQPPALYIFRARSKLERDRWVWAINAEMERQARAHVAQGDALRNYGHIL